MPELSSAAFAGDLVDLLLGGAADSANAAQRICANGGWRTALDLAIRWHVLPAVALRLESIDAATAGVEREVGSSLRAQIAISAMRSSTAVRQAEAALHILADAGVRAVAIKGIASIATLYRGPAERMVSDVDLVIRPADLAAARAAFAEHGYVDRSPPFERHVSAIALSRSLHNFARTFVRDNFEIDLHWQFGPRPPAGLSADRIVERAVTAAAEGRQLRVAGPIEAALLITHHALRGAFAVATTIKDLVDLDAWWHVYGGEQADELIAAAAESDLASSLLALCLALTSRNPEHPSAAWIAAMEHRLDRSGRTQARRLLAFFDSAMRGEAPDSATVALFAPTVYARSLLGPLCREIAWKACGAAPPAEDVTTVRKPIVVRVLRRLAHGLRIGRELAQLRRIGTYRAVARAQSRFH
jgi:hypothetical protein